MFRRPDIEYVPPDDTGDSTPCPSLLWRSDRRPTAALSAATVMHHVHNRNRSIDTPLGSSGDPKGCVREYLSFVVISARRMPLFRRTVGARSDTDQTQSRIARRVIPRLVIVSRDRRRFALSLVCR
jgi:hypothetical protein